VRERAAVFFCGVNRDWGALGGAACGLCGCCCALGVLHVCEYVCACAAVLAVRGVGTGLGDASLWGVCLGLGCCWSSLILARRWLALDGGGGAVPRACPWGGAAVGEQEKGIGWMPWR
jgi:hypothetical protein